jgi:hypothetical protein
MIQKSSVREKPPSVSEALTAHKRIHRIEAARLATQIDKIQAREAAREH